MGAYHKQPRMRPFTCMMWLMWLSIMAITSNADCRECCVPSSSPAANETLAVQCSGCDNVAMQMGCSLDKAGALCAIIPALHECASKATPAQKQRCALHNPIGLPQIIMGTGPDNGDVGIISDYWGCCTWGSTDGHRYRNETCFAVQKELLVSHH